MAVNEYGVTVYFDAEGVEVTEFDLERRFEEMLSDAYGDVKVLSYEYDHARVLKAIDPIMYDTALYEYVDGLIVDGELFEECPDLED